MADEPSTSSKEGGKNLQWMYEGAKSVVNREDYLLGKKIDKNFELFSDVIVRDQEEEKRETFFQESILHPSTSVTSQNEHKVSALDTRIVRTEDPLVALKFQEEQRRRQLLENPVLKLKAQRVLRKAFEKELKKVSQKKSKKRNKHSSPSSSSPSKTRKKHSSPLSSSPSAERRERERHHCHWREESERRGSRNRSDNRKERRRSRSMTRTSDQRSRATRTENSREVTKKPASPIATQLAAPPKKLTVEELEEKRRAMLANASWRDDMRERNLREAADKLKKEREEMATSRSAGFMRPMMNTATEDSSIEKRLQSNRMNIQRQHDHMDKSFIKK